MIYKMNFGHSRRINSIKWIYPPPFDDYKHPLFHSREPILPQERFIFGSVWDHETCETQDPTRFPAWIKIPDEEKVVQDCYYFDGSWIVVSQRVMDKVEELEPQIHQFFPIRILRKDGENIGGNYYVFNIRQKTFSIDADKSPYAEWTYGGDDHLPRKFYRLDLNLKANPEKKRDPKGVHFVYRAEAVGNKVIWREHLDAGTPPNSGKRYCAAKPGGGTEVVTIGEETSEDMKSHRFGSDDVAGVCTTEVFKTWVEQEKVLGISFKYPGCLDTEWKG
jgi:hypothetical protein